ncbi:MAG: hypothetical protein H7175_23680, partial [Burkholderiales bacterium]|nr:hypothetical protein [Anaerolineae bacterium]
DTQILCVDDYAFIAGAAHLAGAEIVSEISDPAQVSVLYLAPSPSPLAGRDLGRGYSDLLEQAVTNNWWIVWDMAAGTSIDFHPAQNAELASKVVTIGSVSDVMPGWRVGWMALGGSQMAEKLRAFKQSMTICSTNVSQWAALEMVKLVIQP